MANGLDTQLHSIDAAMLTPVVRRALGSEMVEVIDWECQPIHRGLSTAPVFRCAGTAQDRGATAPWSVILKVVHPEPDRDDPLGFYYWKREVLAYQSGLLADLPGGVAAPRCFGVVEQPGGEFWLWLEEVNDDIGPQWPLEHYGVVARHLGQFNGAYLAGRPIPSAPWLSRGWLRQYVARAAPGIERLRNSLEHPQVRRAFPPDHAQATLRLWAERETVFEVLNRLPHTLCHFDAFRRNLFTRRGADGRDWTVAIDWAFAGRGAIGEEIVILIPMSIFYGHEHLGDRMHLLDRTPYLNQIVFDGYLEGLHDAGWRGDARTARLGYVAASALRMGLGYVGGGLAILLDEGQRALEAEAVGCSTEEVVGQVIEGRRSVHTWLEEAWELIDGL